MELSEFFNNKEIIKEHKLVEPIVLITKRYPEEKPSKSGRYLVIRKDGKTHLEVWNTSGWAYNNSVIIAFFDIQKQNNRPPNFWTEIYQVITGKSWINE